FVTMFIDEARIAASLTHVNVAQVFEFGEVAGSYYLVMELIEGVDLGRLLEAARRRKMSLPRAVVAFLVAEAARGLAYAHEKRGPSGALLGIVHRDVSPQNILVSYAGEVKIADFGIAKAVGKLHKTDSGAVMGKLRYMSPEQVTGEPLDGRSDVFSLGIVLHELLTGRQLFDGDNPGHVADQVKRAEIEPPSRHAADVPPELDRICLKALARARDARHERAADLARELSTYVNERAPGLTREDVGALVGELVPRDVEPPPPLNDATAQTVEQSVTPERAPPNPRAASPPSLASAPTRPGRTREPTPSAAPAPARSRALTVAALAGVVAVLLAGIGVAYRVLNVPGPGPDPIPPVASADAGARVDAGATGEAARPAIAPAERARLLAELESLPQAEAAWRGVASEDYLAVLSAVEASACAGASTGAPETLAPDVAERVDHRRLRAEALAVQRFLRASGELPPRTAESLRAFLRSRPAFSPGAGGWAMAALALRVMPSESRFVGDLLRENGALRRWRDRRADEPPPSGDAALCDREHVVALLARAQPGPRAEALRRYLAATPLELARDDKNLRYQVIAAERDEAAGTLDVRLRVTNPGSAEQPLQLDGARLAGADVAQPPSVEPPASSVPPGLVRELRLRFAGATDALAEAAVLVLAPGVELQAYSEDLR
ncbi:MAG TPA: protein kinase, partial [Polyangia bacterium]|nr:protein kinase [Polyangia bacterium]